jgi:predicted RNase H-like HicB family nuclease
MKSITLNLMVQGDSYDELREKADIAIAKFLGTNDEEGDFFDEDYAQENFQQVNYELLVTQKEDITSEYEYSAQVIAKVKDVRK